MKKTFALCCLLGFMISCQKATLDTLNTINIVGIGSDGKEIVNIRLQSGERSATSIGCHVMGSAVYPPVPRGFGYFDCDENFHLINFTTGETIQSYPVGGPLSQLVIAPIENILIGQYFEEGTNFVVRVSMEDGEILSKSPVDIGDGIMACTYFYNLTENHYSLLRADGVILSIDPADGTIVKTTPLTSMIDNAYYDKANNRLIGMTYSAETDRNYIEVMDVQTGARQSRVEVEERNDYRACASTYDSASQSFIVMTSDNKVLFLDIETGETNDSYEVGTDLTELTFWRGI